MSYESLMAFFLEASFLGVLLFGRRLVPAWAHFASAVVVAVGTLFSAFWILAANSWMQTPAGFDIVDGRFVPVDWLAVIFNPSFPYKLLHTVTAVFLTTAFTVIGVAAWYLRHGRFVAESKAMIVMGVLLASVLVPAQALIGDAHGLNTLAHQPAKLAAMEGLWETRGGQPSVLFALPDQANLGLAISLFPYVARPSVTLWDATAAPQSQAFLLIGTLVLLPVILTYTGWSYWVFRGKVRNDHSSYH